MRRFNTWRKGTGFPLILLVLAGVALLSLGCNLTRPTARPFAEAEGLFRQQPRWLGGDGAVSIDLGGERILWLFGDTFIATKPGQRRAGARIVHNSIALQRGRDPRTASITFAWGNGKGDAPASFFPERGGIFYWPATGLRLQDGPLIVFLYSLRATPGRGLGFEVVGFAVAIIEDPNAPIEAWKPRLFDHPPLPFDRVPAAAIADDGYVVCLAISREGRHAAALVRFRASALTKGELTGGEWWGGDGVGWVSASLLGRKGPAIVMEDAGSESSLHWDRRTRSFLHVASYGFGATEIGLRTAPFIIGPWSSPVVVYHPPESDLPNPFVYAAKAHPELVGPEPDDLLVTYVASSLDFSELISEQGEQSRYWPRFIAVRLGSAGWGCRFNSLRPQN